MDDSARSNDNREQWVKDLCDRPKHNASPCHQSNTLTEVPERQVSRLTLIPVELQGKCTEVIRSVDDLWGECNLGAQLANHLGEPCRNSCHHRSGYPVPEHQRRDVGTRGHFHCRKLEVVARHWYRHFGRRLLEVRCEQGREGGPQDGG